MLWAIKTEWENLSHAWNYEDLQKNIICQFVFGILGLKMSSLKKDKKSYVFF